MDNIIFLYYIILIIFIVKLFSLIFSGKKVNKKFNYNKYFFNSLKNKKNKK